MTALPDPPAPASLIIASLGGNCPVQATGTVAGVPFYFRARHGHWRVEIGPGNTDRMCAAIYSARAAGETLDGQTAAAVEALGCWTYERPWPGGEFAAGYMTPDDARACLAEAVAAWDAAGRPLTGEDA